MTSSDGYNLNLEPTQFSPQVEADWQRGLLRMNGESYPENTFEFFAQIIAWAESYLTTCHSPLVLELQLSYLNTSSIRAMIDLFDLLQEAADAGKDVHVKWLYDSRNPRASELGDEFKEDYTFPFEILSVGA